MIRRALLSIFLAALAFFPCSATAQTGNARPATATTAGQVSAADKSKDDGSLPQSASALPLLSAVGAGALLGGLLSARRTRSDK